MAGPQTLKQHLIELAEAFGTLRVTATGPDLPDNTYELDKLKRRFNEGQRLMVADNPEGWYCLRRIAEITTDTDAAAQANIDGDNSLYRLPDWVCGAQIGDWEWEQASTTGLSGCAVASSWSRVSRLLAADTTTGPPELTAVEPVDGPEAESESARRMWKLRIWPRPDQAYVMKGEFARAVGVMVELNEHSPFGAIHDPLSLAAAKWAWVKNDSSDARYQAFMDDYFRLLAVGIAADLKNTPERVKAAGGPRDPHGYGYGHREMTVNGVPISG